MGAVLRRIGREPGGILSLGRIIEEHDRALEYDLMTRTGRTLTEYMEMGAAGRAALISFVKFIPPDAALYREMNPKDEFGIWYTQAQTNILLADLFDVYVSSKTKKGRKAKRYPRPRKKQTYGRDPIPMKDFWKWWNGEDK